MDVGKKGTAKTIVCESNTARTIGSGDLDVFSTPMMIALMEQAACACLADELESGMTSVGTFVKINHTLPSPIGASIEATATITGRDARRVDFEVTAYQVGTNGHVKPIGTGEHSRVIILESERFMQKLGL